MALSCGWVWGESRRQATSVGTKSPYGGRDCVKSLRPSYTELHHSPSLSLSSSLPARPPPPPPSPSNPPTSRYPSISDPNLVSLGCEPAPTSLSLSHCPSLPLSLSIFSSPPPTTATTPSTTTAYALNHSTQIERGLLRLSLSLSFSLSRSLSLSLCRRHLGLRDLDSLVRRVVRQFLLERL